jgi:hypothetical protein
VSTSSNWRASRAARLSLDLAQTAQYPGPGHVDLVSQGIERHRVPADRFFGVEGALGLLRGTARVHDDGGGIVGSGAGHQVTRHLGGGHRRCAGTCRRVPLLQHVEHLAVQHRPA